MNKFLQYGLMGVAVIGAFFAGTSLMKYIQSNSDEAKEAAAMVTQYRPGFVLPDLDGVQRNMDEWNGKVVVVNFWAEWCPPCKREMPMFMELQEQYASQGLQFVGIAIDEAFRVENFVDTLGVEYPILLGGEAALDVSKSYGNSIGTLPHTALVGRDGTILAIYRGEVARNALETDIKKAL